MTAQRRSWMLRAGMLVALIAAVIGVTGTAAQAAAHDSVHASVHPNPGSLSLVDGGAGKNVTVTLSDVSAPCGDQMYWSASTRATRGGRVHRFDGLWLQRRRSGCTFKLHFSDHRHRHSRRLQGHAEVRRGQPGGSTKSYIGDHSAPAARTGNAPAPTTSTVNLSLAGQQLYSISGIVKDVQTGKPIRARWSTCRTRPAHSCHGDDRRHRQVHRSRPRAAQADPGRHGHGRRGQGRLRASRACTPRQFGTGNITNWNIALTAEGHRERRRRRRRQRRRTRRPLTRPTDDCQRVDRLPAPTTAAATLGGTNGDGGGSSLLTIVLIVGVLLILRSAAAAIGFMFYRRRNNGGGTDDDYDDDPRVPGGGIGWRAAPVQRRPVSPCGRPDGTRALADGPGSADR